MASKPWSRMGSLRLGRIAECYAVIEFLSHDYDVFTPEIDDHGVDFIAKSRVSGKIYEVQVKGVCNCNYTFIRKSKMPLDSQRLVCYLRFNDGEEPDIYIIPAMSWLDKKIDGALVSRDYELPGRKSKPEYGIRGAKKYLEQLAQYHSNYFFSKS